MDGRDVATDGTKLDTIDTNADVTPSWVPASNPNYLTSFDITTQTDPKYIRSNANDDVTGHTEWQDNYSVRLGSGADFRMYHDGTTTYLRNYNHVA